MRRAMSEDTGLKILMALCIPGLLLSVYLSYGHYRVRELTDGGTVCPANTGGWACNDVLLSEYSEIMGIPVAIIGLVGIVMILVVALWRFLAKDMGSARFLPLLICVLTTGGLGVTSWLTYAEVFELEEICPYCFSVFIVTILLELVALVTYAPVVGKVLRGDMISRGDEGNDEEDDEQGNGEEADEDEEDEAEGEGSPKKGREKKKSKERGGKGRTK